MSYTLINSRPSLRRFSLWSRLSVIVTLQTLSHNYYANPYFSRVSNIIMVTCNDELSVTLCRRTWDLLCSAALHTGKANLCTSVPTGCTMLLVLSEEHKTHLGFLTQVYRRGRYAHQILWGGGLPIPQL